MKHLSNSVTLQSNAMAAVLPELLAPAGSSAAFRAAIAGGADAIYCALGDSFNARRSAENFDKDAFAEACRIAHLAGARVYLTLNVVIREDEMEQALRLVRDVWALGADAIIVQDWGLMAELHCRWPEVEVHVSTQANVHDVRGSLWCSEKMGVKRVTLSRELSLPEIKAIAATGIEVEVFGHGALCFCYSGLCLFSSLNGGRSANRGLCAQPCRLPYELIDCSTGEVLSPAGNGRALCPKDACTIDDIKELVEARVGSLKIEGRMKSPDYVLSVVSAYRDAFDDFANQVTDKNAHEIRHRKLARSFNRDFTDAYLWGRSGNELMSYGRSNNRGQLVGTVIGSRKLPDVKKRSRGSQGGRERNRTLTRAEIYVSLDEPVGKGDLLEFRPLDDPDSFLTAPVNEDAPRGSCITCIAARPMPQGCPVRLIRSQAALDAAARLEDVEVPRRRPVTVFVQAKLGEPLTVTLSCEDGSASATATGPLVEPARTKEVTASELAEHASRLGATPFVASSTSVEVDAGVGLGFSVLHKVRAQAAQRLIEEILAPWAVREPLDVSTSLPSDSPAALTSSSGDESLSQEICVLAETPSIAEAALQAGAERIYVPVLELVQTDFPSGCIPIFDEVCRDDYQEVLKRLVKANAPIAVGNVSEFAAALAGGAKPELRSCIPVHNTSCLRMFEREGAKGIWLSPELSLSEIEQLGAQATIPMGIVVYGRARVMTSEHCVLQVAGKCIHDCGRCELRNKDLAIRGVRGDILSVRTDMASRSRIYAAQPLDLVPNIAELLNAGVSRFAVDATLLDEKQTAHEVSRLIAAIRAVTHGRKAPQREKGANSGHLFAPLA